ncbi:AQP4 isoform 8 [Pan troglodytes]|uniref:Aquaporin 4 n=2 Tax=Homininae TaxID=207598 RepID=H0Y3H5_HUMAN|nr:aquaporin 4 [Homo sapiens]KAI4045867.1 aquaporin 4 [Homo sapiens]PNI61559.1 AQP4 isoform 8 [Pan troglodytes]
MSDRPTARRWGVDLCVPERTSWWLSKGSGLKLSGKQSQRNFWPCLFLFSSAWDPPSTGVEQKSLYRSTWFSSPFALDSALQPWCSALAISAVATSTLQ